MPTVCFCGTVKNAEKPRLFLLREGPCQCDEPGRGPCYSGTGTRVPPTDLRQPADPDRRRLGLPALTDLERGVLPKDQWSRYE